MSKLVWQKRLAIWKNYLYLYPQPKPLPRTRWFWVAMGLVAVLALVFSVFFINYLSVQQDAFVSPAEDFGIMNQVFWSLTHGQLFYQTICNPISDTNCLGLNGFSRFAIHFEPILFPVSLFYAFWQDPKMLLIVQTLVVASGAFPAFWLARLRLRNEWAGVLVAGIYLLYPELQQAEVFFFHAVTMTASLLLFLFYFMYTRRTVWIFVFAVLSMACKEEIPLIIALLGFWSLLFQQRWRTGLGLVGIACAWLGLTVLMYHLFSPLGRPLLASRYAYLGTGVVEIVRNIFLHPVSMLKAHILEPDHSHYIRLLLAPTGYLTLLAPWVLVLALPAIALNLLSSDRNMYLGFFQYSAEIVPVLIFSTIEALVVLFWLAQRIRERVSQNLARSNSGGWLVGRRLNWLQPALLLFLLSVLLLSVLRQDQLYGALPYSRGFALPAVTSHDQLAQSFIDLIPATASVTAQDTLVPHISKREHIYLYPYGVNAADYIFLDVTSNSVYPEQPADYMSSVKDLLLHGNYGLVAAQDGYILLKHGLPAPGLAAGSPVVTGSAAIPNLPPGFCSFINVAAQQVANPIQVDFHLPGQTTSAIDLIGYQVAPPTSFSIITRYLQVTTYWRVNQANLPALTVSTSLVDPAGKVEFSGADALGTHWCPTTTWQAGRIIEMRTGLVFIGNVPDGPTGVTVALLPATQPSSTIDGDTDGLPFQIVQAPATVKALQDKNVLQLQTFTVSW